MYEYCIIFLNKYFWLCLEFSPSHTRVYARHNHACFREIKQPLIKGVHHKTTAPEADWPLEARNWARHTCICRRPSHHRCSFHCRWKTGSTPAKVKFQAHPQTNKWWCQLVTHRNEGASITMVSYFQYYSIKIVSIGNLLSLETTANNIPSIPFLDN